MPTYQLYLEQGPPLKRVPRRKTMVHVLDLLGPPGNEYAAQWREHCRQRLALTTRRKPAPGDMLILAEPLTFTDGQSERSFRVVQSGRKTILRRMNDGMGVKISKLMSRAWTIVPAPTAPSAP